MGRGCCWFWVILLIAGCDQPRSADSSATGSTTEARTKSSAVAPAVPPPSGAREEAPAGSGPPTLRSLSVVGGERQLFVRWQPVDPAPTEYVVAVATKPGGQDFRNPTATVAGVDRSVLIDDLLPDSTYYVMVRARASDGRLDDNELEVGANTAVVRYVSAAATESGDGKSPQSPYRTIDRAVADGVSRDGLNIYVAAGEYTERVFLFDGMTVYGGFDATFDLVQRAPRQRSTSLIGRDGADLISIAPGSRLCGVDGLDLDGADRGRRGVMAADCKIQIVDTTVRRFRDKGIELRSGDDSDDELIGLILGCDVTSNHGEGIGLEGIVDVDIVRCAIHHNEHEGIEVEPLRFSGDESGKLTIDGCDISDNRDLGIDIAARPHADNPTGKCRVTLSNCTVRRNRDHGASLDFTAAQGTGVDARFEVEDCLFEDNGKSGLAVECDGVAAIRLLGVTARSNQSVGVRLSGDASGSLVRVQRSNLSDNHGPGLDADLDGVVTFAGSTVDRIEVTRGWVPESVYESRSVATATPHEATAPIRGQDLEMLTPSPGAFLPEEIHLRFRDRDTDAVEITLLGDDGPVPCEVERDAKRVTVRTGSMASREPNIRLRVRLEQPDGATWSYEFPYRTAIGAPR